MGMLLDYLGTDWKRPLTGDATNKSLVSLLSAALRLTDSEMYAEFMAAKKEYQYNDALKAAGELIQQHEQGFRSELRDFESQPGYRVQIRVSSEGLQRSRSTSAPRWTVDDGGRSLCKRYEAYTLRSKKLKLSLRSAAVLEEQDWSAGIKVVTFFVPSEPKVWVEGKELNNLQGDGQEFLSLKLAAGSAELQTDVPGRILVKGHSITIDLISKT